MVNISVISYPGGSVAVTQSDTVDDANGPFAGFYVGGAGVVKFTDSKGNVCTYNTTIAGSIYPVPVKRIWSSTTTATNIYGVKS